MNRAVFYVATQDEKYFVLALCGALEFNLHNPNVDIYVLTDIKKFNEDEFAKYNIKLIFVDVEKETISKNHFSNFGLHGKFNNRKFKILGYQYLPKKYDQVLYIDADILPIKSNKDVWKYLEKNDINFSIDISKNLGGWEYYNTKTEGKYTKTICKPDQTVFNGGFYLINLNDKGIKFLEKWYQEWLRFKILDQLALCRTIKILDTEIGIISEGYNFCPSIARDNKVVNIEIFNVHLRNWIIPENNLYILYQKHSKVCLGILEKYYSKKDLKSLITRKV